MKSITKEYLALLLGGLTLMLFAGKPYILDLIEPSKSIGQVIGENAKDLIESLNSEIKNEKSTRTRREVWSNIITLLAFLLFVLTMIFSINSINQNSKKIFGLGGILLSIIGIAIYFSHLAIGLIGFIIIAVLVVGLVFFEGI